MSDDPVEQALAELQDLVRCRCHPAYTGRGLRDPDCECDSAEAVTIVADRIEELEAKHQETFQMYVDANEARIDAEAKAAEIERLRGALREINMMINAEDQTFAERLMRASLFTHSALTGDKT